MEKNTGPTLSESLQEAWDCISKRGQLDHAHVRRLCSELDKLSLVVASLHRMHHRPVEHKPSHADADAVVQYAEARLQVMVQVGRL